MASHSDDGVQRRQPLPGADMVNTGIAMALGGLGIMADVYDISVLNLLRPSLLAENGPMEPLQEFCVFAATVAGAMVGQPLFGWLADLYGRRITFVATAGLTAVASIGCAAARPIGPFDVYDVLALLRFVLGIGIGGEYPLAALNTAENAQASSSSFLLAVLLVCRFAGALLGCIVVLALSQLGLSHGQLWRSALGIGALFAINSAALRAAFLEETPMYKALGDNNGGGTASGHKAALGAMARSIAGTAGCWLLFDVTNYGLGMFATELFPAAAGTDTAVTMLTVYGITAPFICLGVFLAAVACLRHVLLVALGLECLCYLQLAAMADEGLTRTGVFSLQDGTPWALVFFALTRGFEAMGPALAVFIVPAQIYPTRVRGTAYGVSASFGRIGALAGSVVVPYMKDDWGMRGVMAIMGLVCVINLVWSWVFIPLYGPAELDAIFRVDAGGDSVDRQAVVIQRILDQGGACVKEADSASRVDEARPLVA